MEALEKIINKILDVDGIEKKKKPIPKKKINKNCESILDKIENKVIIKYNKKISGDYIDKSLLLLLIIIIGCISLIFCLLYLHFHYKKEINNQLSILFTKVSINQKIKRQLIRLYQLLNIKSLNFDKKKINNKITEFYSRTIILILLLLLLGFCLFMINKKLFTKTNIDLKYKSLLFLVVLFFINSIPLTLYIVHYSNKYLVVDIFDDI
tara:strand:- start:1070 stop:1696 length:627 start_codon:yes stop_codon:yes gene_type:complete